MVSLKNIKPAGVAAGGKMIPSTAFPRFAGHSTIAIACKIFEMDSYMSVFERLTALLDQSDIAYQIARHEPVFTSEEAARVRGTSLASGAKALICRADASFVLFVMPADRKLDSKQVRKAFGLRSLRFATRDEVLELTQLQPGSIPPFGQLFGLKTYCDEALAEQPRINFNAGDHTISIGMSYDDYVKAEQPSRGTFAVAGDAPH
jgi:Ala-tRNA(Pro) deacylase